MKRIPELDGLRGLAAILVVVAHFFGEVPGGVERLKIGWLGVEVFFVLSGFLIGSILLRQPDLPTFYLKRTYRILPVYWLTLAGVFAATAVFGGAGWIDQPFSPTTYLLFGQNIVSAFQNTLDMEWLRPAWTLAVEEQFYLLLPVVILATPRRGLPWVLGGLWVAALVFRVLVHPAAPLASYLLLPARMDLFISGVLAAWALARLDLTRYLLVLRIAPIPLLLVGPALFLIGGIDLFGLYGQGVLALGIACFILALALGAPEGRGLLRQPGLIFAGQISYALYLFHQPINGLLHGVILGARPNLHSPAAIFVTCLALACTVGAAYLSYCWLEEPLLRRARLVGSPRKLKVA